MRYTERATLSPLLEITAICSALRTELRGRTIIGEVHDFYELVYVEEGSYGVILDGVRYTVPPGSFLVFPPNAYHSGDGITENTATVSIISFDSSSPAMASLGGRTVALTAEARAALSEVFSLAFSLIERCADGVRIRQDATPPSLQLLKNRLECFLLSHYSEGAEKTASGPRLYKKEQISRLTSYLKAHLAEKMTLDGLAAALLISRTALKELCREFFGCGPIDYLISLRVAAAKELIRTSAMNFTEIAEAVGFESLHYFSRVFKARTGLSPSQYAKGQ